ncbi:hypothetical protein ATJ97_0059 [Georgenia soli]|uniref:Uncharacterized protein n=1 Tax=Georgenia soli TaxID=638953 RepID=A0A2A9F163_9MICO|nr:hypothetical protein [Georgenia soli]PFG45137.1 hypothetical protein ATJ97_0059 [Georgenia soli]
MTYRQHSASLAQELATLFITNGSRRLDSDGLDVALLGRRLALGTIRHVTATVTRRNPDPGEGWKSRAESVLNIGQDPVFYLQRTLAGYPAPAYRISLVERMKSPPQDPAAASWYRIAKYAELAAHDFTAYDKHLTGEHRWTVVADAAAIGRTLYVLDGHLIDAARKLDNAPLLAALTEARHSALPLAAEESLILARSGPLPDLDTVSREPTTVTPVRVDNPTAAVEAQARLRRQLTAAADLSPEAIGIAALTQARLLNAAEHLLSEADPSRAHLAGTIGEQLRKIRVKDPQVAALVPGSQLPLVQSRELARFLHAALTVPPRTELGEQVRRSMAAIVDRAPALVSALAHGAHRQVWGRRWAVSYAGEGQDITPWGMWTEELEEPRILKQLDHAKLVADAAKVRVPHAPTSYTPLPHAHQSLNDVARTRQRPPTPRAKSVDIDR